MSHPYKITIYREAVARASDRSTTRIALLEVLPEEEMRPILIQVLQENGWKKEGGIFSRKEATGEKIQWDLQRMEVTAQVERSAKISVKRTGKSARPQDAKVKRMVAEWAEEALHRQKEEVEQALTEEASQVLEVHQETRDLEINRVLLDVYARALKKKASTLGEIEEIEEEWSDDRNVYSLKIQINE